MKSKVIAWLSILFPALSPRSVYLSHDYHVLECQDIATLTLFDVNEVRVKVQPLYREYFLVLRSSYCGHVLGTNGAPVGNTQKDFGPNYGKLQLTTSSRDIEIKNHKTLIHHFRNCDGPFL